MGAIVGGLYAIGYSPDEMLDIISNVDWDRLISNQGPDLGDRDGCVANVPLKLDIIFNFAGKSDRNG